MLLIFSCGRSGTNLCLEMFTDHWDYTPSVYPEDKLLFSKSACPESYLTKSDSVYCKSPEQFVTFMKQVPHCKVLWTARRVEDWAMSKIYRGWGRSDDATFEGCLEDFYHMFSIYKKAIEVFPDRIKVVKMEDVLKDITKTAKDLSFWLNIEYSKSMERPYMRMRHKGKRKRYPTLDKSQVDLYKNWDTIYNGFFTQIDLDIEMLFKKVQYINKEFNYDTIC